MDDLKKYFDELSNCGKITTEVNMRILLRDRLIPKIKESKNKGKRSATLSLNPCETLTPCEIKTLKHIVCPNTLNILDERWIHANHPIKIIIDW